MFTSFRYEITTNTRLFTYIRYFLHFSLYYCLIVNEFGLFLSFCIYHHCIVLTFFFRHLQVVLRSCHNYGMIRCYCYPSFNPPRFLSRVFLLVSITKILNPITTHFYIVIDLFFRFYCKCCTQYNVQRRFHSSHISTYF